MVVVAYEGDAMGYLAGIDDIDGRLIQSQYLIDIYTTCFHIPTLWLLARWLPALADVQTDVTFLKPSHH